MKVPESQNKQALWFSHRLYIKVAEYAQSCLFWVRSDQVVDDGMSQIGIEES